MPVTMATMTTTIETRDSRGILLERSDFEYSIVRVTPFGEEVLDLDDGKGNIVQKHGVNLGSVSLSLPVESGDVVVRVFRVSGARVYESQLIDAFEALKGETYFIDVEFEAASVVVRVGEYLTSNGKDADQVSARGLAVLADKLALPVAEVASAVEAHRIARELRGGSASDEDAEVLFVARRSGVDIARVVERPDIATAFLSSTLVTSSLAAHRAAVEAHGADLHTVLYGAYDSGERIKPIDGYLPPVVVDPAIVSAASGALIAAGSDNASKPLVEFFAELLKDHQNGTATWIDPYDDFSTPTSVERVELQRLLLRAWLMRLVGTGLKGDHAGFSGWLEGWPEGEHDEGGTGIPFAAKAGLSADLDPSDTPEMVLQRIQGVLSGFDVSDGRSATVAYINVAAVEMFGHSDPADSERQLRMLWEDAFPDAAIQFRQEDLFGEILDTDLVFSELRPRDPASSLTEPQILAVESVKRLAALVESPGRVDHILALQAASFSGARSVVGVGQDAFIAAMEAEGTLDRAAAQQVYARAVNRHAAALHAVTALRSKNPAAVPDGASSARADAEIRNIVGSLDACECTHCSSVLSPAAYMVDMLDWLADIPADTAGAAETARDVFAERRPDVLGLPLTCDNTHTPESALELAVGVLRNSVGEVMGLAATDDAQLNSNLGELSGIHVRAPAWRIPFSVDSVQANAIAVELDFHAYRAATVVAPSQAVQTGLLLSQEHYSLLTESLDDNTSHLAWGYASASDVISNNVGQEVDGELVAVAHLGRLDHFLERTELSFDQVQELLVSWPALSLANVTHQGSPVERACSRKQKVVMGLNDTTAGQLYTALRLSRQLGVELWEVLPLLVAGDFDDEALVAAAHACLLATEMEVPVGEMAPWFGVVDTRARPSDPTWVSMAGRWFGPLYEEDALRPLGREEAARLLAEEWATRPEQLLAVCTQRGTDSSSSLQQADVVRLASLRVVADIVGWSVSDVITAWLAVDASELDGEDLPAPPVLLNGGAELMVRRLQRIQASGWTHAELLQVLRGDLFAVASSDLSGEAVARDWVQAVEQLTDQDYAALVGSELDQGQSVPTVPSWLHGTSLRVLAGWRSLVDLGKHLGPVGDLSALALALGTTPPLSLSSVASALDWPLLDLEDGTRSVPVSRVEVAPAEHWIQLAELRAFASPVEVLNWFDTPATAHAGLLAAVERVYSANVASSKLAAAKSAAAPAQREALVEYLRRAIEADSGEGSFGESQLLQKVLSDVYTGTCTQTTAVLEAITAVQLFVHHIMRGLEEGVAVTNKQRATWKWMKNYRVWEVSRKLYLWPDNWLLPDLRANKSHLFRQFEDALASDELTDGALHDAVLDYAKGLDELSGLSIDALCVGRQANLETTHLFGRTRTTPRKTFYRAWQNRKTWLPWEPLPFDVDSSHLVPLFHNGRLFLHWPIFVQMNRDDREFWAIHFMRSEKRREGWTTPQKLEGTLDLGQSHAGGADQRLFFFTADVNEAGQTELTAYLQVVGMSVREFELNAKRYALLSELRQLKREKELEPQGPPLRRKEADIRDDLAHNIGLREDLPLEKGGHARVGTLTVSACSGATQLDVKWRRVRLNVPAYSRCGGQRWKVAAQVVEPSGSTMIRPSHTPRPPDYAIPEHSAVAVPVSNVAPSLEVTLNADAFFDDVVFTQAPKSVELIMEHRTPNFSGDTPFVVQDPSGLSVIGQRRQTTAPRVVLPPLTPNSVGYFEEDPGVGSNSKTLDASTLTRRTFSPPQGIYEFGYLSHPFSCEIVETVSQYGPFGVLDPVAVGADGAWQIQSQELVGHFAAAFSPDENRVPAVPDAVVDFEPHASMALYNYELFLYAPMLVAMTLSKRGEFERATDWFHALYDPRQQANGGGQESSFKVKPLANASAGSIASRLSALLGGVGSSSDVNRLEAELIAWSNNPFDPHAIAQTRPEALQRAVVLRYLEHLLEWADSLFRRDTREDLTQALPLYLTVKDLLGGRPLTLPGAETDDGPTFAEIDAAPGARLDRVEAALVERVGSGQPSGLDAVVQQLPLSLASNAFCMPRNDRWDVLWDRVDDRLHKLRNCMNIDGVVWQLPFFEPPLDPMQLLRQFNQVGNEVGAEAPATDLRFAVLLGRARQAAELARSFAGTVQSALASRDAEQLQALRAHNQLAMLELTEATKRLASNESRYAVQSARRALESAQHRERHYADLVSRGPSAAEQAALLLDYNSQLTELMATPIRSTESVLKAIGTVSGPLPATIEFGPSYVGESMASGAEALGAMASAARTYGMAIRTVAGWERRAEEWELQRDVAGHDVAQLQSQLGAAELRVQMADKEYDVFLRQRKHAREEEAFLSSKFTSTELYNWMKNESSALLRQAMDTAIALAKGASAAASLETGGNGFEGFDEVNWNAGRHGLLAPEHLLEQLTSLELAHSTQNLRRAELTKHVSLAMISPAALVELRTTGQCTFNVPKGLLDLDYPWHTERRIRSVAVTMPSTTGRYGSVSAVLSLTTTSASNSPSRTHAELSTGQGDGGVFRLTPDDARYLPFEYHDLDDSGWRLVLAGSGGGWRTFDWSTIADVVLTIQFEGVGSVPVPAPGEETVQLAMSLATKGWLSGTTLGVLRSFRHDAPDAWHQLVKAQGQFVNRYGVHFLNSGSSQLLVGDPTVGRLQLTHDWSIAFWHYVDNKTFSILLSQWDGAHGLLLSRHHEPNRDPEPWPNYLRLLMDWDGGRYNIQWHAPPEDVWAHIVLVNEGHSGSTDPSKVKLYIDGVLQSPFRSYGSPGSVDAIDYAGSRWGLGVPHGGGGECHYTHLDEMMLFSDRALTPEETLLLRDDTTSDVPAAAPVQIPPTHYWRFGDAANDLDPQDLVDLANGVPVRPTVFHDVVGEAHFELTASSPGTRHSIETFDSNREYRSGVATIELSLDDLPFAVRHLVKTGAASLEITGLTLHFIYDESEEVSEAVPTAVQWGPAGATEAMVEVAGDAVTVGNAYVVPYTFPEEPERSTFAPVTLVYHDVPTGLADVVVLADWQLVIPSQS